MPIFIPSKDGEIKPISIPNADECWFYRRGRADTPEIRSITDLS